MTSLEIQAVYAAFEDNDVDLHIVLSELNATELKWFADKLDILVEAVDRKLDPGAFDCADRATGTALAAEVIDRAAAMLRQIEDADSETWTETMPGSGLFHAQGDEKSHHKFGRPWPCLDSNCAWTPNEIVGGRELPAVAADAEAVR